MESRNALIAILFVINSSHVSSQDSTQVIDYNFKFNISGRFISGIFEQFVYSSGIDFTFNFKNLAIQNNLSYRFNKTGSQTIENNWYELLVLSYHTKKRLFPTVFYHFDNNLMFRVNKRHLAGGGVSTKMKLKNHSLRLDVGAGYDHSRYRGENFENSNLVSETRSRGVFMLRLQTEDKLFKDKLLLTTDFFYRHSFIEVSDFFVIISTRISLNLFKNISIHSSFEYRFENVYLSGLSANNSTLLFGLTYQLQGK